MYMYIYLILKLIRTNLNYHALVPLQFLFQAIILSMNLLSRKNDMLDFICMRPVDLQGASRKRQNTK